MTEPAVQTCEHPARAASPWSRWSQYAARRTLALLALSLGLSLTVPSARAADPPLPEAQVRAIDAAVAAQLAAYGAKAAPVPGVMVGIWAPGQGTLIKGYGLADVAAKRPMAAEDKFRIGSNTKTFVVTVLLQLVDEKRLSLDDPLSKFKLGVTIPNAANITVRQLCNMTSGLYEVYHAPAVDKLDLGPNAKVEPRKLIEIAVAMPPDFPPGKGWHYSNTGYLLLGLIIEAVTGQPANVEIENRLLKPLALKNTTFPMTSPAMPAPNSRGYTLDEQGAWIDQTVLLPPGATWTAGVMISDLADMRRWVEAYVLGTTNSAATQAERLTCVDTGQPGGGFGLGVGCSAGWYGYTGGIPGYNTAAFHHPKEKATLVVFVNSQRETPSPGVANAIVREITRVLYPANVFRP